MALTTNETERKQVMKRNEYNEYNLSQIKKMIERGKKFRKQFDTEDEMLYNVDLNFYEYRFVLIGFDFPDFEPKVEEFYRIGEPAIDDSGCYKSSWNYAEDHREDGVSVVTTAWLNSMKSVFFGSDDETLRIRGVYKIKGFALPTTGGDDEVLIVPLDWAEKTRIRTRNGLAKAVKQAEQ